MVTLDNLFDAFFGDIQGTPLARYSNALREKLNERFYQRRHGDLNAWLEALNQLPEIKASQLDFSQGCVQIGHEGDCNEADREKMEETFRLLHPWRKGPFNLFGIHIDTEWRSDLKWARVEPHISSLQGRKVLDVGSGNGYYCLRMLAQEPQLVVGVDPSQKFLMQFRYLKNYLPESLPVHYLPLRGEDLPEKMQCFDTVFSMGVLYHRRSPFDHLEELRQCLAPGGELVLETLVIEGDENQVLVPKDRYAQMPNVWFIPSEQALIHWLERAGFSDVRLVNTSHTTTEEQRATDWMNFHSLPNYLDPEDPGKTIEGYPAPRRAAVVAKNL